MPRLRIVAVMLGLLWWSPAVTSAGMPFVVYSDMHPSVTGTVHTLSRDNIEIVDENDGRIKRFVYFYQDASLKVGDRVRVYFSAGTRLIERLEKMTPVEYKKDGQNTGYIFKK